MTKFQSFVVASGIFFALDIGAAQLVKLFVDDQNDFIGYLSAVREYRIRSDIYHHDLARNVAVRERWGSRRPKLYTNSLGFKAARVESVPLVADGPRLVFIGDSFAEGSGVEYPYTFVGIIDKHLAEMEWSVLGAGVSSYSPAIYYRKVKHLVEDVRLEFDRLVVFLDISDIHDEAVYYEVDERDVVVDRPQSPLHEMPNFDRVEEVPERPWSYHAKRNSVSLRVASLVRRSYRNMGQDLAPDQTQMRVHEGDPRGDWTFNDEAFEEWGRTGLETARQNMTRLLDVIRDKDIVLTLVVYPWPNQILARDDAERHTGFWREWAAENDVHFVNLFPDFLKYERAEEAVDKYFIAGDIHWNEAGHGLVAASFLREYLPVLSNN